MVPHIQLRLVVPKHTPKSAPRLQSRFVDDYGVWQEWIDVPLVVIDQPMTSAELEARRQEAFNSFPDDFEVN